MSQYSDLIDGIVTWTNRPRLVAEMDLAIKQAIRTAHRAAKFARDCATVPFTLPTDQIQYISIADPVLARFDQVILLGPTGTDIYYDETDVSDLLDADGYARLNVYYLVGSQINIRAQTPAENLTLVYRQRPNIPADMTQLDDWIADEFPDLIILWAAASVLGTTGEPEILKRISSLAVLAREELISSRLTLSHR